MPVDEKPGDPCEHKTVLLRSHEKEPSSKHTQNADDLYNNLGDPGRLQIIWFFLLACSLFTAAPNAVVGVFFGFSPAHFCNASSDWSPAALNAQKPELVEFAPLKTSNVTNEGREDVSSLAAVANVTSTASPKSPLLATSIYRPRGESVERSVRQGECSVNITVYGGSEPEEQNVTRWCRSGEWVYDISGREATTVTDFDLVCTRSHLTHLASFMYYLGLMLANMTLGYASDVLGRRPVILFALYMILFTGLGIAFSTGVIMFMVLRLIMGVLSQGLQSAAFVMAIELFPAHHRGKAGSFFQVFWGLGSVYVSAVAWLVQDWRLIQLVLLAPTLVCAISYWYVGESIRWLLAKGKTQAASLVVKRITKFNKIDHPLAREDHSVLLEYSPVQSPQQKSSYLALVRTPQMRLRTISLSIVLFGINLGYFGMTYNNAQLAGSRYLNFLLGSVTELIAYAAGSFLVVWFGRKRPLFGCLLAGAVCCLISGVIPRTGGVNHVLVIMFSVLGRFAMAGCYTSSEPFTAELFPTVVRATGIGVCIFMGRLGSALAPVVSGLRTATFSQLPPLVFAAFALLGAAVILLLPETADQSLPDTVDDVEKTSRKKSTRQEDCLEFSADQALRTDASSSSKKPGHISDML